MADNDIPQTLSWAELESPDPKNNFAEYTDLSGGWLPKTDWSRDRIIANHD